MEPQQEKQAQQLVRYPHSNELYDAPIDLRELFKSLWRGKWVVIAITFTFAVGSVIYALSLPNVYKADALLSPAESAGGGGLSKMAGQLGGLAALAGVNLGGGGASQTDLAVQVMKSRQFAEAFIEKYDLLVPLMAAKDWDLSKNQLILDDEIYNSKTGMWVREPDGLRGSKPTPQEAYEVFSKNVLSVNKDDETGLYTVSVQHFSPYLTKQWVNWLIEDINKVMRERTISEVSQNLTYLNTQLQKTSVAEMQSTFYSLIEEQTKSLMLAEVQDEFIFKTVDPAVVPELKSSPNRALICVIGTLLGGILGMIIILVHYSFKEDEIS
ncbi:Wzz/FepE/Etk N-terminal domain-containing protein [Vibrio alginolyticus]